MNLDFLDKIIIILFFLGIILFTVFQNKFSKKKDNRDYFLANNKMSWIVAMFSIVATETSVLTFVGIPALAYQENNWMFLQLVLGYILGRIFVSYFFKY